MPRPRKDTATLKPLPPLPVGARLKMFRAGKPVGPFQQKQMDNTSWALQTASFRAALGLIKMSMDSTLPPEIRLRAHLEILDRGGFPKRTDLTFSGAMLTGTPQDYQAALQAAVTAFMARRGEYVVHATDAVEFIPGDDKPDNFDQTGGTDAASPDGRRADGVSPDGDPGPGGANGNGSHG